MKSFLLLVSAGLFGLGSVAAAAEPALRQPASKWVVDYGETQCRALRRYGSEAEPVVLAFVPSPGGLIVRIVLSHHDGRGVARHFRVATNISADAKLTGLRFNGDRDNSINWINVERADLGRLAETGELSIKMGAIEERFAMPGFAAVLSALDTCTADLRRFWQADAEFSRPPKPAKPLKEYISFRDYPSQALMEGATGTTGFILLVDETGRPKDCMVQEPSGIATLDAMSCIVFLERARFDPALDAAGKPVRSTYSQRVKWATRGL